MKLCPQCRRDYHDDTLVYCLDDGRALLDGPGGSDEPATAILPPAGSTAATAAWIRMPSTVGKREKRNYE